MAQGGRQTVSLICTVDAVDKDARTVDCTPLDEGAPLLGVNLQANQESKFGVVVYPRVGSYVVVGFVADGSAGIVLMTDDVESIEMVVKDDNTSLKITEDGIVLNGGKLGGLVKIQEIKDNLDTLKQYCEALTTATSAGIAAVGAAMSANGATGAKAFDTAMSSQSIVFKDMENEKVKQ